MSLKSNELKDSVKSSVHIDEYSAKMGDDSDILVLSFKVSYKDQASDLVNWFEKGYEWILDADVSAGEMEDGEYLVFVELQRRPSVVKKILKLLVDLENITDISIDKFEYRYHDTLEYKPVTLDNLSADVPLTPRDYKAAKKEKSDGDNSIKQMQMQAGLAPKTESVTDPELKHFVNLSKY